MRLLSVANAFIHILKDDPSFTPMKLQRLLFIAENTKLKLHNESLHDEFFCRWQKGPVIPSLYHRLKYDAPNQSIKHYIRQFSYVKGEEKIYHSIVDASSTQNWAIIYQTIDKWNSFTDVELSHRVALNIDWQMNADNGEAINHETLKNYHFK
jgi:uncharacterized phage-associated protein